MPPKVTPIKPVQVSGRRKGTAPAIRRMKINFPELSEAQIAKRVGCAPSNVHNVLARFLGTQNNESDLRDYQEGKADIFDALQMRMHTSITQEDIANASLRDRVVSGAILEDKARVIRGQATQINVSALVDVVQALRDMRRGES